ncbi:MAG: hypothetical protein JWP87_834 [Labilithrix sp.]|nr:hypothetical protein [Labilithrix sp.]
MSAAHWDDVYRTRGALARGHRDVTLLDVAGDAFEVIDSRHEAHRTPGGAVQSFVYVVLERR